MFIEVATFTHLKLMQQTCKQVTNCSELDLPRGSEHRLPRGHRLRIGTVANLTLQNPLFGAFLDDLMVRKKARSLVRQRGALTAIVAAAPAATLAEPGTTALPRLGALLSALPVVALRDGTVLVVGVGCAVLGPVTLPELLGVVIVLAGGGDVGMPQTHTRGGATTSLRVVLLRHLELEALRDGEHAASLARGSVEVLAIRDLGWREHRLAAATADSDCLRGLSAVSTFIAH